jgi:hypothetical protein
MVFITETLFTVRYGWCLLHLMKVNFLLQRANRIFLMFFKSFRQMLQFKPKWFIIHVPIRTYVIGRCKTSTNSNASTNEPKNNTLTSRTARHRVPSSDCHQGPKYCCNQLAHRSLLLSGWQTWHRVRQFKAKGCLPRHKILVDPTHSHYTNSMAVRCNRPRSLPYKYFFYF